MQSTVGVKNMGFEANLNPKTLNVVSPVTWQFPQRRKQLLAELHLVLCLLLPAVRKGPISVSPSTDDLNFVVYIDTSETREHELVATTQREPARARIRCCLCIVLCCVNC